MPRQTGEAEVAGTRTPGSGDRERERDGDRRSLADTAYELLRRDILRCRLEPSQQVSEMQLAEEYGVGRGAVRAALNRLAHDRLIQIVPYSGYRVQPVTLEYVHDLYEARVVIECAIARRATGRVDAAALRGLNDQLRDEFFKRQPRGSSAQAMIDIDTEIHLAIAAAADNAHLSAMLEQLLNERTRVWYLALRVLDPSEEMFQTSLDHGALIDALASGHPEIAEQEAIKLTRASEQFIIESLMASPSLRRAPITLS